MALYLPPTDPIYKVPRKLLLNLARLYALITYSQMEGVSTIEKQLYRKDIDTRDRFTTQIIISDTLKLQ